MSNSLGQIAGVVTLNIDPFKQSAAALNSSIKATGQALKAQESAFKSFGSSVNGMKASYSTMQQQAANLNAKLQQQTETYQRLSQTTANSAGEQEKLTRRQGNAAAALNRTQAQATALEGAMSRLGRQIAQQDTKWYSVGTKMQQFGDSAVQAGQKMSTIGTTMTSRVTAPIVAGFGYAAKSAIDFNSQISSIGPLLQANGESASQVKSEMSQMADASKQWATEYGVSTSAINSGLEELVKRGYSANQAMGAMPSILDAARASGDDFNSVMSVSTSTLEQFGLKSNTTAGMLKNTQRVTDSLTFTANATAAGFQDMGDAMTYVGPTAHAAGISLEETAAAIGLMSNQGIEGSVAGTALRSALTRLMKPSKQNAEGFKELGVNVADFKKGTLSLPEILDKIKTNTKGWTKEQRAAAIATAFGTEAQAGMNALVSEGGKALTDLTTKTEKASGSTKKIAKTMNETEAAKIQRFKESLHVLAIDIGENLVPTIMPLIKDLTQMVKKFGQMDKATQQSIIKWAAFAAAIGPALSLVGGMSKGLGALSKAVAGPVLGVSRLVGAAKSGATGLGMLKAAFSKTAYESGNFATKTGTAGASVAQTGEKIAGSANTYTTFGMKAKTAGSAVMAFATANPVAAAAIVGVTAALTAGVIAYEVWGKSAIESAQRTSKWGSDVGKSADQSLAKMQKFTQDSSTALKTFSSNAGQNSQTISKSFSGMSKEITKLSKSVNKDLTNSLKKMPASVAAIAEGGINKQKAANIKMAKEAQQASKNITRITSEASKEHRKLSDDENQYILNAQQKMHDSETKLLGLSGKQRTQVMKALNSDVRKMTVQEAGKNYETIKESLDKQNSAYKKQAQTLKNLHKQGLLDNRSYSKAMKELDSEHTKGLMEQGKKMLEYGQKTGMAKKWISDDLKKIGLSYDEVAKASKKGANEVSTSNSRIADTASKMSGVAKQAGQAWNHMVLDPKTGRIKTDAQKTINDTAKTEQGWSQLQFELKHAKITSNAKSMIGEAAIESGRWDSLPWKDKKAMLRVQKDKDLTNVVKDVKDWDHLSMKEKTAIVRAKGREQLAKALVDAGEWDKLPMKDKNALVTTTGERDLITLLDKTGLWNNLSVKAKEAVIKGKGNAEVVDQLNNAGKWNDMTMKEKSMVVNNKATAKIADALIKSGDWNNLSLDQKNAVVKDEATAKLVQAMVKSGAWNTLTLDEKNAVVNDKATGNMVQSLQAVGKWDGIDLTAKNAIIEDKASAPIVAALVKSGEWNSLPMSEKQAIVDTKNSPVELANLVSSYGHFNSLPDSKKNLIINNEEARQRLVDSGVLVDSYNNKSVNMKTLKAENSDVISKLKTGESTIVTYNGKEVAIKKMKGDNVDVLGKVETGKSSVQTFNDKNVDIKKMLGDPSNVQSASKSGTTALDNFNGKDLKLKHLRGKDDTTGPGNSALGIIRAWNSATTVVHKFVTEVSKVFKNEGGTTDFDGGLSYVNDQRGPVFRELIKLPTGETFIPEGRNVMLALPRHSQVVPAKETNRLMGGIPQFANGTPGYSTVVNELNNLSPTILSPGNSTYNNSTSSSSASNVSNDYSFNINVSSPSGADRDVSERTAKLIQAELKNIFNKNQSSIGKDVII